MISVSLCVLPGPKRLGPGWPGGPGKPGGPWSPRGPGKPRKPESPGGPATNHRRGG